MSQTKIIRSGDMLEVYEYDNPYFEDFRELFSWSYTRPDEKTPEERARSSRAKTKNRIKRLIQANVKAWGCAPILITYTFAENVSNLDDAHKKFRLYTQRLHRYLLRIGFQQAKYIAIVEFQKRGAVHYHAIYFNIPFIPNIKSELASLWGHGFIQVKAVQHIRHMGNYLVKYLQKASEDSRLYGRKAYMCSKHLKKPVVSTYPQSFAHVRLQLESEHNKMTLNTERSYQAGLFGSVHYKRYKLS